MTQINNYNVHFDDRDDPKGLAFKWLGAKVSFKLFGVVVHGVVNGTGDGYGGQDPLLVEVQDGRKQITITAHPNCFNKLN
jgi:hypothetical protein